MDARSWVALEESAEDHWSREPHTILVCTRRVRFWITSNGGTLGNTFRDSGSDRRELARTQYLVRKPLEPLFDAADRDAGVN